MNQRSICEYLEWDSKFFGRRIARSNVSVLTREIISEIEAWCQTNDIQCLYFLASSNDVRTVELAKESGFRLVDRRISLDRRVEAIGDCQKGFSGAVVRDAVNDDIPGLRSLARRSHRDSRFYHDGNFPVNSCDELYETWIEKSCRGWADKVLVAAQNETVQGYLTCHIRTPENGQIGLVGVSEQLQGKGIGRELMWWAMQWLFENGLRNVSVVTQGRNVRAQRFYEKCGFTERSAEMWFHRWWNREARKS